MIIRVQARILQAVIIEDNDSENEDNESKDINYYMNYPKNIYHSRDQLYTIKDYYAFFVDTNGLPIDNVSRTFALKKIDHFGKLNLSEIKALQVNRKYYIGLCVKSENKYENPNLETQFTIIKNTLNNFKNIILEKGINSISLTESKDINNIEWDRFLCE